MTEKQLEKLVTRLKRKYGTHRNVASQLGITEEWYYQIRTRKGSPSGMLEKLMKFEAGA